MLIYLLICSVKPLKNRWKFTVNGQNRESPYDLRRHPLAIRYILMAAFCPQRSQEITANLFS